MGSDIGLFGELLARFIAVIGCGIPVIAFIVLVIQWWRKR